MVDAVPPKLAAGDAPHVRPRWSAQHRRAAEKGRLVGGGTVARQVGEEDDAASAAAGCALLCCWVGLV